MDRVADGPAINAAELQRRLEDPDVPEAELRPFLVESAEDSGPFRPMVQANPARVDVGETEAAIVLGSLNGVSRRRRQRRYRRKVASWKGLRIVSEGDSWFQYPFLLTDVIDWLSEPYAIWSLDAAGDLIADMVRQGELLTAVVEERPDVVLLSGGGNDLLGNANLARALLPFEPGRLPGAYLADAFNANLRVVLNGYDTLFKRLARVAPQTPILCHVYDHAVPNRGRWLGRPLAAVGIEELDLQRSIIEVIVDRFHDALRDLARNYPKVRLVDTRGTVVGRWHDELHPTDAGYAAVAQLFAAAIAEETGTAKPDIGTDIGIEAALELSPMELELAPLASHSDDVLLTELGRRRRLREAGDPAGEEPLLVYPSSLAGDYPGLRNAGVDLLRRAHESLPESQRFGDPAKLATVLTGERGRAEAVLLAELISRGTPAT